MPMPSSNCTVENWESQQTQALIERVRDNPWILQDSRKQGIFPGPNNRQAAFLLSPAVEVLYGGAAGGGKSWALLAAAAMYVDVPGYAALLLRRTFPELAQAGGLIPKSKEWWTHTAARWNEQRKSWTFPSGATIAFGYVKDESDVYQYHSSEFQYIGWDELTEHKSSYPYTYLFSRLRRRAGSEVPLRVRSGTNPGGPGHQWVYDRFLNPKTREPAAVFIPASLDDNPQIDRDPYIRSLHYLDPLTRDRLLAGDWEAVETGRFPRDALRYYRVVNEHFGQGGEYDLAGRRILASNVWTFATVDPAATEETLSKKGKKTDPDYTVISVWGVTPRNELLWLHCHRIRREIPDIVPEIEALYHDWRCRYVGIEAVAANSAVYQIARRKRMVVKQLNPLGRDKLVRATAAINLLEDGRIWIPERALWLAECLNEVLRFTGDPTRDAHDDVVDTWSYAAALIGNRSEGPLGEPEYLGR